MDFELNDATLVQPDVFVLPVADGRLPVTRSQVGQPLLFVEVLSSSTARYDRVVKRARYRRPGVEYLIVDLDARLVERWMPNVQLPEIITGTLQWQPSGVTTALTIDLDGLFAEVQGERLVRSAFASTAPATAGIARKTAQFDDGSFDSGMVRRPIVTICKRQLPCKNGDASV